MALAGWDVEQSTSDLGGVLNLAAASGMELGAASDMVTDYLSAFGMEADKAAYFADLLSYAQSSSNTTAEALGEAYKNCAANLNAAGQDVETVTSLLEGMANQGYKAKVTAIYPTGKHPYHLIAVSGSGSTVYGWVDASAVKESGEIAVGDVVQFAGGPHYTSANATSYKTSPKAGPAKVTAISKGAKHPYHIVHTTSASTVYG